MNHTTEQIERIIAENNERLRAEFLPMASDAPKPKPRTGMINCVSELKEGDKYYVLHSDGDIYPYTFNNAGVYSKWINQGNAAWGRYSTGGGMG